MNAQLILADKTVSVSELRKNPSKFFGEEPIAVLSNNHTAGYVLGKELFETMMRIIDEKNPTIASTFRPNKARLEAIASRGAELLLAATKEELDDFEEHTGSHK